MRVIKFISTDGIAQDMFQSYTCLLDEDSGLFFIHIGENSIEGFTQSTFTNAIKLAKMKSASKVFFIVARDNPNKSEYRDAFKLIDLKRVSSVEKKAVFRPDTNCMIYSKKLD